VSLFGLGIDDRFTWHLAIRFVMGVMDPIPLIVSIALSTPTGSTLQSWDFSSVSATQDTPGKTAMSILMCVIICARIVMVPGIRIVIDALTMHILTRGISVFEIYIG
jgi:hypothetical protein